MSLETRESNLKSVALTVLELYAFNAPNCLTDLFATHIQTHNPIKTVSIRIVYLVEIILSNNDSNLHNTLPCLLKGHFVTRLHVYIFPFIVVISLSSVIMVVCGI